MDSLCRARGFLAAAFLVLCIVSAPVAQSQAEPEDVSGDVVKPAAMPGKRVFNGSCAGCHGIDGRGGEHAPNIAAGSKVVRLSNAEVTTIVSNGIPGAGMPAFRSLGASDVRSVVSYLRALQGREKSQQLPGDADRGKAIFYGKGDCSSCHIVQGNGGFAGPDLSTYAWNRSVKDVLKAIVDPVANTNWKRNAATAVTRDGQTISGAVRNEDNFSVELLSADGTFHFFSKSELQSFDYQDHPTMPLNYSQRLSRAELDDVASYLLTTARISHRQAGGEE